MIKVTVEDGPRELRAAVLALSRAPAEIRKAVNTGMRQTMNPVWRSEVSQHLTGAGRMEGRLLTAGARIAGGNPPQLVAASSKRRIGSGGGLVPSTDWPIFEFGSYGTKTSEMVSKRGTKYTRHTRRGLPTFVKTGRVLYPAAASVLPRIAAFWTQTVVRVFMDALDGKAS